MHVRLEREPRGTRYLGVQAYEAILPLVPDDELETPPLPHEHPQWLRDAASVSQRTRSLLSKVQPLLLRILSFWDHRVRSAFVGGRCVSIDASGSYRAE